MFVGLFAFVRAKNMISKKYKNSKFQPKIGVNIDTPMSFFCFFAKNYL